MKLSMLAWLLAPAFCLVCPAAVSTGKSTPPSPDAYRRVAGEAEEILQKHILDQWFPRAIDRKNGGFSENFGEDWSPGQNNRKNIVYQSRLTWLSARAAAHDPERAEQYSEISSHGLKFLAEKHWDQKEGGMYWTVDNAGNPTADGNLKHPYGGFYDMGSPVGEGLATEKIWWVQAEGLNVLLLMHERFGNETQKYWNAFVKQWDFIKNHQIDYTHGGRYSQVHENGAVIAGRPKSDNWTEGYHQGRAMMNVIKRLRHLAEERGCSMYKKVIRLSFAAVCIALLPGLVASAYCQAEVMGWGNLTGIRVEGQLMEFESSLCVIQPDWIASTCTKKEGQTTDYSRSGQTQTVKTNLLPRLEDHGLPLPGWVGS